MKGPWYLVCLGLGSLSAAQKVLLPRGEGPYNVTIRTSQLVDSSRPEIFSNKTEPRRLMVSVFSPLVANQDSYNRSSPCQSPYMPHDVATMLTQFYSAAPPPSNFTIDFSRLWLQACSIDVTYGLERVDKPRNHSDPDYNLHPNPIPYYPNPYTPPNPHKTTPGEDFPLVMFGPGLGFSRLVYNVLCQFLASHGFIVVSVDHPYDAILVKFPDNSTTFFAPSEIDDSLAHIERDLLIRTADVSFVLDELSANATLAKLIYAPGVRPRSLNRVGIWGHSFGGATAVTALLQDARFAAGINVDGTVFGPAPAKGIDKPLVLWQSELGDDGTPHDQTDETWEELWSNLRGWKRYLQMQGAQHAGLSDLKLLADLLGTSSPRFGKIDGLVELQTLAIYARDFFNFALAGKGEGLLSGPSEKYPQVKFLR